MIAILKPNNNFEDDVPMGLMRILKIIKFGSINPEVSEEEIEPMGDDNMSKDEEFDFDELENDIPEDLDDYNDADLDAVPDEEDELNELPAIEDEEDAQSEEEQY